MPPLLAVAESEGLVQKLAQLDLRQTAAPEQPPRGAADQVVATDLRRRKQLPP